jgi:hypothetical protein
MLVVELTKVGGTLLSNSTVSLHNGVQFFVLAWAVGSNRDESSSRLQVFEDIGDVFDVGSIDERWIHDNPVL